MLRTTTTLTLGLALAACTVGPNYRRPTVTPPPPGYEELPASGQWKVAQPADTLIRAKWWEAFGDPELNALEEQVTAANQTIVQAEARFRAARAAIRGVRADLYPTVTVAPSATRTRPSTRARATGATGTIGTTGTAAGGTSSTTTVTTTTTTDYTLPVDASYEVDLWGRVRRGVEASVANAQALAADLETARLSMHAELATDYFELHGLDGQIALLRNVTAGYETALKLTIARHDQGIASGVDVAQAETQLATTRAQATDLGIARAQFEHAIAMLTGRMPAQISVRQAAIGTQPPAIPVALPSQLLERRPDIAASERAVAAANAQIGVAKAAYFPTLSLTGSAGVSSIALSTLISGPAGFWSIGAAVAQTVFEGGRRRSATEQATANYEATVAAYRQTVLNAFQDVEDNLATLRVLEQEAGEQQQAVTAAERALQLANERYRGGITTYLEVITAQGAALANERTAIDLLTRRMTASVGLVRALGGGWQASDLPAGRALIAGK